MMMGRVSCGWVREGGERVCWGIDYWGRFLYILLPNTLYFLFFSSRFLCGHKSISLSTNLIFGLRELTPLANLVPFDVSTNNSSTRGAATSLPPLD